MGKKTEVVPEEQLPQVQSYLAAQEELEQHLSSNMPFYNRMSDLIIVRNQALADAEIIVKNLGVSCGPFRKTRESLKIDIEKLYEELGEKNFKELGGYTEKILDYKLDRARFLAYLESNQVPQEVADVCVRKDLAYDKPKPYNIP